MCGIAGVWGGRPRQGEQAVQRMCAQMLRRGPDDGGVELFERNGTAVALGARRLAILDPSPAGHQPMVDRERGTTIVFNGLIFNFEELRKRLVAAGETFASRCDTEVLLKAYGRYGVDCVHHLRGAFAFAIWDEREQLLFLARDRFGVKPLYYSQQAGRFLFASQVKTLLASGLVPPRLSRAGLETYLTFGAVSEPLTAIDDVFSFPAAHTAVLRNDKLSFHRYWHAPEGGSLRMTREDAVHELRARLEEAVRLYLLSDVPLGVFLSGGLDSSVLVGLAAREAQDLCTVSVVFDDPAFSEAPYMDLVAARAGSRHVRVTLQPRELLDWLDDAFVAMDQPSFDGLNTYAVSRAAREAGLTVTLSGLGADDLFDGFDYQRRVTLLERARQLPRPIAGLAGRAAGVALGGSQADKLSAWLAGQLAEGSSYELLRRLFLPGDVRRLLRDGGADVPLPLPGRIDTRGDVFNQLSLLSLENYTRNVLLRDIDALSMAHSIDLRAPYLDHVLVEWLLTLPGETKAGRGKAMLAEATRDVVPAEVTARRKQGFLLPLADWMRGELGESVDGALRDPPRALADIVASEAALGVWQAFGKGRTHWLRPWALYALCRWTVGLARTGADVSAGVAP